MDQIKFDLIAERTAIRNDQPSEIDVAIDLLTAKSLQESRGAASLNLCIVIDKSGSMAGADKLEQAKRACIGIYNSLNETDKFSVLAFDDDVLSVVNPLTPRPEVISRIEALQADGSTNLSKGWYLGLLELQTYGTPNHINRLMLLSDGQATDGEQKVTVLEAESSVARDTLGITTTAIGIGDDFQEDVLSAISVVSGGRLWYINDAKIEDIIEEEFSGALSVILERPGILIEFSDGVSISKELNNVKKKDNLYKIRPIKANDQFGLAFRLSVKPENHPEGYVTLKATLLDGAGIVNKTELQIPLCSVEEYVNSAENYRVAEIVGQFQAAASGEKIMQQIDAGDSSGMLEILKNETEFLKNLQIKLDGATVSTLEEHEARRLAELQMEIADQSALVAVAELLQLMQGLGLAREAAGLTGITRKSISQSYSRRINSMYRSRSDDFAPSEILEQGKRMAEKLILRYPDLEDELNRIQGNIDAQLENFSR
jgi:Ca-activated chloride channel homolog